MVSEEFEKAFPAQFIAEGLDQTRGWFYTLMAGPKAGCVERQRCLARTSSIVRPSRTSS